MYQPCKNWTIGAIAVAGLVMSLPAAPFGQTNNSKINRRDRNKNAVTADQQTEHATDREFTQKIRRVLVQDKRLSRLCT
jgi:hypothetical protein